MDERDQHVDRLLREAMRGPVRAETADCLDVETVAAWSEGSLPAGARAQAEAHAATCTRCQSLLAAMIRTQPVVAAAPPSPFRKWLMVLGPALGAAAAVALWFAVDRPVRSTVPEPTAVARVEPQAASNDREELKKRDQPRAMAEPAIVAPKEVDARKEVESARKPEQDKVKAVAPKDERGATSSLNRLADGVTVSPPARAKSAEPVGRERVDIIAGMPPSPVPPATPPPPPAEPSRANERQSASGPAQTQSQIANQNINPFVNQQANQAPAPSPTANTAPVERRAADAAAPAPPPAAAGVGGRAAGAIAGARPFGGLQETIATIGTIDVPTANASVRYRVLEGRTVQRTVDAGQTWATAWVVFAPATLRGGTAPSPTVCWLVGTNGLVLTTRDGVTWREARLPEAADIQSIKASDATSASVITVDGRTFTTVNGGTSWSRAR